VLHWREVRRCELRACGFAAHFTSLSCKCHVKGSRMQMRSINCKGTLQWKTAARRAVHAAVRSPALAQRGRPASRRRASLQADMHTSSSHHQERTFRQPQPSSGAADAAALPACSMNGAPTALLGPARFQHGHLPAQCSLICRERCCFASFGGGGSRRAVVC